LAKHLKERKYFDSGDYALSKAGKASSGSVGSGHPLPENIPHFSSPGIGGVNGGVGNGSIHPGIVGATSASPVKESSFLARETSIDDVEDQDNQENQQNAINNKLPSRFSESVTSTPAKEGIPIRR
jgi:hypothetical protein